MPTYRLCVAAEMILSSAFKNTYFRQQNALQPGMLVRVLEYEVIWGI